MSINPLGVMNSLNTMTSKTGFGGLTSGIDVDEMVVGMTTSGRLRIAKEQQNVQKLEWKQDAYRSVTKALEEFQASYLDLLSKTNLRSESTFNTKKTEVSSALVSVTATASAGVGDWTIDSITQLAKAQTVTSAKSVSASLQGDVEIGLLEAGELSELLASLEGESIALVLDGRVRTITFDAAFVFDVSENGFESAMQMAVDRTLGVEDSAHRTVNVSMEEGRLSLAASGSKLEIRSVGEGSGVLKSLGLLENQSNRFSLYQPLRAASLGQKLEGDTFSFSINGTDFSFDESLAAADIMRKINSSEAGVAVRYSELTDTFTITSNVSGAGTRIEIVETEGNLLTALGLTEQSGAVTENGQDAILSVNGLTIMRASNSFTVDGLSVELHGTTKEGNKPIAVLVRSDTSALKEPIEEFLKDYNALVDLVSGYIAARPDPKYPPLTDDQKNEMSEKQIEKWEETAKKGILYNDPALRNILTDLRMAMQPPLGASHIRLHEMGIASGGYSEQSKWSITDSAKFEESLRTKGDAIARLFADQDSGIAVKLQLTIESAIRRSVSSDRQGRLIALAGVEKSTSDKENSLSKSIEKSNKKIEEFKKRLQSEEQMLWKRFTAMETALQRFEAQSMMLMQFTMN